MFAFGHLIDWLVAKARSREEFSPPCSLRL